MQAIITEFTTSEEPFCEIENASTGEVGEYYGSIEDFKAAHPDVEIIEEIWD